MVILNPYADRWNAGRRRPEVEAVLRTAGIEFEIVESEAPEHAIQLARESKLEGYSPLIAAGGDGTIGEVVNGLYAAQGEHQLGPLGIIPLGTANDLAHNLKLPIGLEEAARSIADGMTRTIDVGQANQWLFCNNSAVGLEPVVSIYNIRMAHLRGVMRYLVAALRAIYSQPEWVMRIHWDGGDFEGPVSLVSVGNCPLTGGLFRMAPAAVPTDGLLTFVYGYAPTRRKMLTLLPRAIQGSYVNDPAIFQHHTRELAISAMPDTPIQVDGEVRSESISHVSYRILPHRLEILG